MALKVNAVGYGDREQTTYLCSILLSIGQVLLWSNSLYIKVSLASSSG
jgi:hypothetical protein